MKLKKNFEEENIGKDRVMVSLDNTILNGIIRANSTASFIIDCLKEDTSMEQIIEKLACKYNVTREKSERAVRKIVEQLQVLNLIE